MFSPAKFAPLTQINLSLNETSTNSRSDYISFISQAQQQFHDKYNRLLHVVFSFYVMVVMLLVIVLFLDALSVCLAGESPPAVAPYSLLTAFLFVSLF
jgi:hypothetical protein